MASPRQRRGRDFALRTALTKIFIDNHPHSCRAFVSQSCGSIIPLTRCSLDNTKPLQHIRNLPGCGFKKLQFLFQPLPGQISKVIRSSSSPAFTTRVGRYEAFGKSRLLPVTR